MSAKNTASLEDLQKINLTLGPKGSYFTTTKDGPVYRDIPTQLHEKIQSEAVKAVKPRQVSLGQHDSYICLWDDETISYSLNLAYTGLASKIQEYIDNDSKPPVFVAMNPYDNNSWFLVGEDGQCAWHLENMENGAIEDIQETVLNYLQRRAREDGTSFTETTTLNGTESSLHVTPLTNFDKSSGVLSSPIMKALPQPMSKLLMKLREPIVDGRGKRNGVVFGLASFNLGIACRNRGVSWRTTIFAGGAAGIVTLAALKCVESV